MEEYLYDRRVELKMEIKKLDRRCFDPQVRPYLKELHARLDEINKAIRYLEHE